MIFAQNCGTKMACETPTPKAPPDWLVRHIKGARLILWRCLVANDGRGHKVLPDLNVT